ncbi:hypothetical protein Tco_0464442 [Tanacetum coccineum]
MFKVFDCCLTTRTSGHDQTKINILQLFHAVVNRTNVDYVALLWWDFMNCVFQKKDIIQYPRFTKLIIADLMKKYPSILKDLTRIIIPSRMIFRCVCWGRSSNESTTTGCFYPRNTLGHLPLLLLKQSTTPIPPPSDDRERDEITEATLLSLTLHKTALAAEAQENVAKVQ